MQSFSKANNFNLKDEYIDSDELNERNTISYRKSSLFIKLPIFKLLKYSELIQEEFLTQNRSRTITEIFDQVYNANNIDKENFFSFLKIFNEEDFTISNDEYCDFCRLSKIFKVKSLQKVLLNHAKQHSDDVDFIIKLIKESEKNSDENILYNDEIYSENENLLINNIEKCLQNDEFGKLNISTIHRIICKAVMKNMNYDLLFDFIKKSIENRCVLFSFLNFSKMSDNKIDELYNDYSNEIEEKRKIYYQYLPIDLIYQKQLKDQKNYIEKKMEELIEINKQIENEYKIMKEEQALMKESIRKLEDEKKQSQNQIQKLDDENHKKTIDIPFVNNENHRFNGIFTYLMNGNPQNIKSDRIVNITTSSGNTGYCIIDYNLRTPFSSNSESDSWICFDFQNRKIKLTHYSLRSSVGGGVGNNNPQNWNIEASNDCRKWIILDSKTNEKSLDDIGKSNTFEILKGNYQKEFYRYIRIFQTGINTGNNHELKIHSFEIFGEILEL